MPHPTPTSVEKNQPSVQRANRNRSVLSNVLFKLSLTAWSAVLAAGFLSLIIPQTSAWYPLVRVLFWMILPALFATISTILLFQQKREEGADEPVHTTSPLVGVGAKVGGSCGGGYDGGGGDGGC